MRNRVPARPTTVLSLLAVSALLLGSPAAPAWSQDAPDDLTAATYRAPARTLVDLVDAPPSPAFLLSPTEETAVLLERPNLPPIDELSGRELKLGGLRIDPATNGPSRMRFLTGLTLLRVADGEERAVSGLPASPRLSSVRFSPDGAWISFLHTVDDGIELWAADVAAGRARRLGDVRINAAAFQAPHWLPDSRTMVVPVVPAERADEPVAVRVPSGPVIQESAGRAGAGPHLPGPAPERPRRGALRPLPDRPVGPGDAGRRRHPAGRARRARRLRPVPRRALPAGGVAAPALLLPGAGHRFPRRSRSWSLTDGSGVAEIHDLPLQDDVPIAFGWSPTGPGSTAGGRMPRPPWPGPRPWTAATPAPRPRPATGCSPWRPPSTASRRPSPPWSCATAGSTGAATTSPWSASGGGTTRRQRTWRIDPAEPEAEPTLVFDYSWEDRYDDPGDLLTTDDARGREVLRIDPAPDGGDRLYLIGDGASPEGDRPFLDALDLCDRRRGDRAPVPLRGRPGTSGRSTCWGRTAARS